MADIIDGHRLPQDQLSRECPDLAPEGLTRAQGSDACQPNRFGSTIAFDVNRIAVGDGHHLPR
jgi:hypothetical protein